MCILTLIDTIYMVGLTALFLPYYTIKVFRPGCYAIIRDKLMNGLSVICAQRLINRLQ